MSNDNSKHIDKTASDALNALKRARDRVVSEAKKSVGYIIVSENGKPVRKPV